MLAHQIIVPMKPIPQGRARVPRFGKPYYPKTSNDYRAKLVKLLVQYEPIKGPVAIEVELYGARVDSDLDNHAKMILDALSDARIIEKDDVRIVRQLSLYAMDGEPARTVIRVAALEEAK
jgi:Holliday junction resolvase RusA-like endonuclease